MQNHLVNGSIRRISWLCSTIGRKQLVGVTGLGLSLFVLTHMIGNMLILVGPQAYNEYGHALISNPLIYLAEAGLVVMFVGHLFIASRLTFLNWGARDQKYAMLPSGEKRTTWIQRSLWAQGLVIFAFLVLHLITFKYGEVYTANYGKGEIRDLHRLVIEVFSQPEYIVGYIFSLIVLGLHLSHGVGSSLQTLGINHPRYQKHFKTISIAYAVIVTVGFLSQPIYVFFLRG
jgi:succinate dehydrogenase / fumarate reductase cytochrome b subunit